MNDPKTFYQYYGYDIEINVGSLTINTTLKRGEYGLCDQLQISGSENTTRTAIFTFIPPEDVIDLEAFQAQEVDIFIRVASGWHQVFNGFVDVPKLDFMFRKVTLECNDQRSNRVIQLDPAIIQGVGTYSDAVFGVVTDQSDELDKRLQTVAASFDFDVYGNPILTPWLPKVSADYTFNSSYIRQGSKPSVSYSSRKKTINTVNLTFNYNYQRLHQQCANFVWVGFDDFIRDWYSAGRPSFPTRTQVNAAATGSNWKLVNPNATTNVTALWPAGGYSGIVWQPNEVTYTYTGRTKNIGYLKDSLGNFVTVGSPPTLVPQVVPVNDANGKQIMDVVSETIRDTSSNLCRGATFTSALRFSQNVTEVYNMTIYSAQSVNKYGIVDSYSTTSITDPYDSSKWENSETITQVDENFYVDKKATYNDVIAAIQVAYNKARHDILQVHRDVTVSFDTKLLQPQVDLRHTINFTVEDPTSETAYIHAVGKVSSITHSFDFKAETAYTNINLLLSRADGVGSTTNPYITIPEQNPGYIGVPQTIELGTHLGINPDPNVTLGADKWTGWVGNKNNPATETQGVTRTNYTEAFIVDFPAIPDSLRDTVTYSSDTSLGIAIPNDTLVTST